MILDSVKEIKKEIAYTRRAIIGLQECKYDGKKYRYTQKTQLANYDKLKAKLSLLKSELSKQLPRKKFETFIKQSNESHIRNLNNSYGKKHIYYKRLLKLKELYHE